MLRSPLMAFHPLPAIYPNASERGGSEVQELTSWVRAAVSADAVLREAIEISSPPLARTLDQILEGVDPPPRKIRRVARSLVRYLLRMRSRSTPFGVLAGVGQATIGSDAFVRWGDEHQKIASVDLAWLSSWVRGYETRPDVLVHLQVVVNNLCRVRGHRLLLADGRTAEQGCAHLSVRLTDPIRSVLEAARTPTPYRDVRSRLQEEHPDVPGAVIDSLLRQMTGAGLLLTRLHPVPGEPDPLTHVMSVLEGFPDGSLPPDVADDLHRIHRARQDLAVYGGLPVGSGLGVLRSARARLQVVHDTANDHAVQVDLALDIGVKLPRLVAAEAEGAANVLTRLSAAHRAPMLDFHRRFVRRYGVSTLVPVKEVLDPERGVSPPAGYRHGTDTTRATPPAQNSRDRILSTLAQEATRAGAEVVLSEELVLALSGPGPHDPPPTEAELCAHLLASSTEALTSGDFLLALTPAFGSPTIGAMTGRFSHLFHDGRCAQPQDTSASTQMPGLPPLRARLEFPPRQSRNLNILRGRGATEHIIPLGTFSDPDDPRVLAPDDLFVSATSDRLFLYSLRHQREVTPVGYHALNYRSHAPQLARLLREIGLGGTRPWQPWLWGAAVHLPHLPRVRYRRTILAPARWRVPAALHTPQGNVDAWQDSFARWRDLWDVPDMVQLLAPRVSRDRQLVLDLREESHRRLCREELGRHDEIVISECPSAAPENTGWSAGHGNEVVFPLTLRERFAPRSHPASLRRYEPELEHLPGGSWLSAQVSCSPELMDDVIVEHLPRLLESLPGDDWFLVRYDDPHPHLRLRFRDTPDSLNSVVLPRLRAWVAHLRDAYMVDRLDLTTYAPESGRYGSGSAMTAAEQVFITDSHAVLDQLRCLRSGRTNIPALVLAAANHVEIARSLLGDDHRAWFEHLPKNPQHQVFRAHREIAFALASDSDGAGHLSAFGGERVMESWNLRRTALAKYRAQLDGFSGGGQGPQPETVLTSLLHMHVNRLLGISPETEAASLAVARDVVRAQQWRTNSGRTP
ncbi:lantibiotic dehydratase [Nocardiopsis sp. NPDC006938]|uniref:lantibiotic dehydratase n=1 Tax=Nocardiopsis sp. NPDC006938 TaxID=3364337 RepID=UPI0036C1291D